MRQSTNYELNLVEGADLVNPLTQDVPNYEKIDEVMKSNENASIGKAVELVSATVHALTRTWKDTPVFRFTATANYTAGETFTVDGLQVTALLPSGEPLASNSYITGSEVLCSLNSDTMLMTVFVSGGDVTLAKDSERLGGQLPAFYATKTEVDQAQSTASAAGVVAQAAQSAVTALEAKVGKYESEETAIGTWIDGSIIYRKVIPFTRSSTIAANTWASASSLGLTMPAYKKIIDAKMVLNDDNLGGIGTSPIYYVNHLYNISGEFAILNIRDGVLDIDVNHVLILEYTK